MFIQTKRDVIFALEICYASTHSGIFQLKQNSYSVMWRDPWISYAILNLREQSEVITFPRWINENGMWCVNRVTPFFNLMKCFYHSPILCVVHKI